MTLINFLPPRNIKKAFGGNEKKAMTHILWMTKASAVNQNDEKVDEMMIYSFRMQ
jgi:hypothetical protein